MRLIEEHREKWCEQNIRRHYKDLMTDLQEFLGVQYAQLAVDDKLTYEILHEKGMYARFLEEVEQRINKFTPEAAQEIRTTVQLTYQKAYEGIVDAVEKAGTVEELHENLKGLRAVTPEIMKRAVENPISGLTLNDTLEKNRKEVIYNIKQVIGVGLSQGDRMSTMAKRISDQVDKDYRKATTIARTECHRVREAGYQDSSERLSQVLKDNDSDYVMTKTWKTMQDEAVRPQRKAYKRGKGVKARKKHTAGLRSYLGGPNHVKMHGVTILVEEEFDLGNGVTAKAPGQSGVAGHDINCRCYLSRDLMTRAEYEQLSGKKVVNNKIAQYETEEKILLDEKSNLESEQVKLLKRQQNLESYEYDGIWKDKVTPADYEFKKDNIQAKRDYYNDELSNLKNRTGKYANTNFYSDADCQMKITQFEKYLKDLDDFEIQGKNYLKLKKQISDIDIRMSDIDDEVKAVRQKLMKAHGIDPDKMQKEIDDIVAEINKLNKSSNKPEDLSEIKVKYSQFSNKSYTAEEYLSDSDVKNVVDKNYAYYKSKGDPIVDEYDKFFDEIKKYQNDSIDYSSLYDHDIINDVKGKDYFTNKNKKEFIDAEYDFYKSMTTDVSYWLPEDQEKYKKLKAFFDDLDNLKNSTPDAKEIKKLQKQLKDKQDELDKVRKRYGLEDDKFSQRRKDAAHWFTDNNGSAEAADKVYRPKAGEVWRKATKGQKDSAYEYTKSYHKYNEPLRGIEYGTNKFLGVGNVDLNDIGVNSYGGFKRGEVKKLIDDFTDIIDNSAYDSDIWLQRGCRYSGMDKFFNIGENDFFELTEKEMADKILGTTPTEYAFMSTGVAKGKGLNLHGGVVLNIYAPKGTKMIYAEPWSAFGKGAGKKWDGISQQTTFGHEAEMILQRNTQFRVIKVEKKLSDWFIDLEVIGQRR